MSEQRSQVIYQEVSRDFRTEIPNVVFQLLESREISSSDFTLYCTYRRIAGEHGGCWVGIRGLEIKSGLTDKTITKSKKNLSRPFEALGGKSLIHITPCNRQKELAETVTIIDIWQENHSTFKNKLTCRNLGDTGAGKEGTRVPEKERHKNEPLKKEQYKKKSNESYEHVDNFKTSLGDSLISAEPTPAEGSIPFHKKSLKQTISLDDPDVFEILEMDSETSKYFRPFILTRWMEKFGPSLVLETLKYFFQVIRTQKKPIPKPEAWMESAFIKKYAEVSKSVDENKDFAEKLKKTYALHSLKINKRYCQDTKTGKDYYYYLPTNVFQEALKQMCHD